MKLTLLAIAVWSSNRQGYDCDSSGKITIIVHAYSPSPSLRRQFSIACCPHSRNDVSLSTAVRMGVSEWRSQRGILVRSYARLQGIPPLKATLDSVEEDVNADDNEISISLDGSKPVRNSVYSLGLRPYREHRHQPLQRPEGEHEKPATMDESNSIATGDTMVNSDVCDDGVADSNDADGVVDSDVGDSNRKRDNHNTLESKVDLYSLGLMPHRELERSRREIEMFESEVLAEEDVSVGIVYSNATRIGSDAGIHSNVSSPIVREGTSGIGGVKSSPNITQNNNDDANNAGDVVDSDTANTTAQITPSNSNPKMARSPSTTSPAPPRQVQPSSSTGTVSDIPSTTATDSPKDPDSNKPRKEDNEKPLTLSDLERVLNRTGYLRREDLESIALAVSTAAPSSTNSPNRNNPPSDSISSSSTSDPQRPTRTNKPARNTDTTTTTGTVAFPQPSIVSDHHLRIGSSISSFSFSFLVFTSVKPNLWLVGGILGAYYGYALAERMERQRQVDGADPPPPQGMYADAVLRSGRKIAETYLKLWDLGQSIWFMYRTGQLSYEYYKRYETMDAKFKIKNKVDAWNARFVEGKTAFDRWERENEVGRKVLAGLRTAWMVNENSYRTQQFKYGPRRQSSQSKYRLIRYSTDLINWTRRLFRALYDRITGDGNDGSDERLREILQGTRLQLSETLRLEFISQRAGAAIAALIAVNLIGAMFAIAPSLLATLAIFAGIVWPGWVGGAYRMLRDLLETTRAKGRGDGEGEEEVEEEEEVKPKSRRRGTGTGRKGRRASGSLSAGDTVTLVDRNNFHYYIKNDGKRRYYRTGKSKFGKIEDERRSSQNARDIFHFIPFGSSKKKKNTPKTRNWNEWMDETFFSKDKNEIDKRPFWNFSPLGDNNKKAKGRRLGK